MGIDARMLVKTRTAYTPQQVRALAVDLAEAFGPDHFWIWPDWNYNKDGSIGQHALQVVPEYEQDGDAIYPEAGETFLEVHPATRYYGKRYERGDLPLLIGIANWIEARIPDARIFYGGDSSGVCAEPFDKASREEYWAHFCKVGHKPYRGGFAGIFELRNHSVRCDFCDVEMISSGGGNDRSFYNCVGCGKKAVAYSNGRVVVVPKGKDFFDMERDPVAGVSSPEMRR